MRILALMLLSIVFFSCDKFGKSEDRLNRTESHSYTGYILHTEYEYDNRDRIIRIIQYRDSEAPTELVSITYEGNKAILRSKPDFDPAYDQTKEVELTLDAEGKTQKRIEYTYKESTVFDGRPAESYSFDTLIFEYDATGYLAKTTGSRYDSTWSTPTWNQVTHVTSNAVYTVESGNIVAVDQNYVYPRLTRNGTEEVLGGGRSE